MLGRIAKKLLRVSKQRIRRVTVKSNPELARLRASVCPRSKAIGDAIFETVSRIQSPDEQQSVERIERRRAELLATQREIPKVDYGAGSWKAPRTEDEVQNGVESTATVASIARASKPVFWATLLAKVVKHVKPTSCVELGSCVGISAAYQAFAMQMNDQGYLYTLEGSPETAKIAAETLETLGLSNAEVVVGRFQDTLDETLKKAQPIDYFFNDGHHDRDAVLRYFEQAKPFLADNAVVTFDDISWSPGMRQAWEIIEKDDRVMTSVDLHDVGVVVLGERKGESGLFRIPL
jgi:predicted O-methyltransferase YrrM